LTPFKLSRTNKTDDWLTPPELVRSLGAFDLDPCASHYQSQPLAAREYKLPEQNGLLLPWEGRVWCNPPFSQMKAWAARFSLHGNGVMICPMRMQVKWSQVLFDHADGILFLRQKVRWAHGDGTGLRDLFDFMLVAMGITNVIALQDSKLLGCLTTFPLDLLSRNEVKSLHHDKPNRPRQETEAGDEQQEARCQDQEQATGWQQP